MRLGEMELEAAAKVAAGNHRTFQCFAWHRQPDDAENFCIVYTHNRDSGLLDQSNAAAIDKAMEPFLGGDVVAEHHHHWACGWIDGYSIRVYRRGRITKAFKAYHALAERLANYPVLDEEDYSSREYEATLANLPDAAWKVRNEYDLPESWESEVFSWFWEHDQSAVENRDDQGGYPTEDQLRAAFEALGFKQLELV